MATSPHPPAPREASESLAGAAPARLPSTGSRKDRPAHSTLEFRQEASGVGVRSCPSLLPVAPTPCVPRATAALAGTGQGLCAAQLCALAAHAGTARHGTALPRREQGGLDKTQYFRELKHLLL